MRKVTIKDIDKEIEEYNKLSLTDVKWQTKAKLIKMIKQYRKQGYEKGKENGIVVYGGDSYEQ